MAGDPKVEGLSCEQCQCSMQYTCNYHQIVYTNTIVANDVLKAHLMRKNMTQDEMKLE